MKLLLLLLFCTQIISAQIRTERVEYKSGDTILEGFVAYDEMAAEKRPGVLIVHEWWGLNDYIKSRAQELAREGYVAFAVDMFGDGKTTTSPDEAKKLATGIASQPEEFRKRITAGFEELLNNPKVDTKKLAAIGFCFGGRGALDLARSGAALKGVAVFHSSLPKGNNDAKNIKARILILHGADDKFVSDQEIADFRKEMDDAGITWQMNYYSKAVHAFTNPNAGNDPSKGLAYNERAAKMSWKEMHIFFDEIFADNTK